MIEHHFSSGVYAKETRIPAGSWLVQHAHLHDHLSILASGSVELMVDDKTSVLHAPACLTIEAGKHHGVRSITDVIWYCIHATNCADADEVDNVIVAPADHAVVLELAQKLKGD
jgi:mannose-6-phosphate isomerase-like protein (cupin superfamily)